VFDLTVYQQATRRRPFDEWLNGLRDKRAQSRILIRLRQVRAGSLGDSKPVGEGILELRVDVGAGYRIYCGRSGSTLIVLLCGGDKASQSSDIKRAKEFWADWKGRKNEES
jgi:putative addiction module killer protein